MKFNSPQEFYDFCVENRACKPGLQEIRGLTAHGWWEKTQRGDWMLWLRQKDAWEFSLSSREEYDRQEAPLRAEYDRWGAPFRAEFDRRVAPLRAELDRQFFPFQAQFDPRIAPLRAEFDRRVADLLRRIVGNPF